MVETSAGVQQIGPELLVWRVFVDLLKCHSWRTGLLKQYMVVSVNGGTPKSSILIGFSIINHPFWGTPIFGNTHMNKNIEQQNPVANDSDVFFNELANHKQFAMNFWHLLLPRDATKFQRICNLVLGHQVSTSLGWSFNTTPYITEHSWYLLLSQTELSIILAWRW